MHAAQALNGAQSTVHRSVGGLPSSALYQAAHDHGALAPIQRGTAPLLPAPTNIPWSAAVVVLLVTMCVLTYASVHCKG